MSVINPITYSQTEYLFMHLICKTSYLNPDIVEIRSFKSGSENISVIITVQNGVIVAYKNKCPHNWSALDMASSDINSVCKQYIQCSSHFAQFNKSDGYCVYGPCIGQSLFKLDIVVENGLIYCQGDDL